MSIEDAFNGISSKSRLLISKLKKFKIVEIMKLKGILKIME
jgi:hypothetical protein